ncbi:hypothetical protein STEG23_024332 [Scotinomys teguina]
MHSKQPTEPAIHSRLRNLQEGRQRKSLSSLAAEHLASWFVLRSKIGRECIAMKQVKHRVDKAVRPRLHMECLSEQQLVVLEIISDIDFPDKVCLTASI